MITKCIVAAAAVMTLAGCGVAVEYTQLNPPPSGHQPVAENKVEIFTSAAPSKPFVELGTMKGVHDSIRTDEDVFAEMKREAAERGCDALIVTQRNGRIIIASCVAYKAG